ncbi:MAG: ribonuclease Y [Thermodesulfobacteriota bacterium]|nr:ribonuclease Y [Thermodesulfobacteriota bacterium]
MILIIFIVSLVIGCGIGFFVRMKIIEKRISHSKTKAKKILDEAKKEAKSIIKEAKIQQKDELYRSRSEFDKETKERRTELYNLEKRLIQKEENLDKKINLLDYKENSITKREKLLNNLKKELEEKGKKYDALIEEGRFKLERIAGITSEEAKKQLMQAMEEEAKHDCAKIIKRIEDESKLNSDKVSKNIIALAIQRYSADYVADKTVSLVNLPNDEMKGRIIGREGRNIRAIEAATGVDLIIDDTPEAVLLSAFDPIRREIARISLEKLINDGRIHPARIEEIVDRSKEEIEKHIKEIGEQATFDIGVHQIHPELVKLIGKLKYRTSFDQNVLRHSLEVAFIVEVLASEININSKQAKRAGLLHDIGKAVDHEVEGSHAILGADLARKYNEDPEIIHAIKAHHDEEKPETILAILIQAADALSAARPGARREMLETYIKHLEDLEEIANSFSGVNKSYAVQAGREIRIIVESKEVSDEEAVILSRDVAKKIENTLSYPGQVKVTVIRETRAVEFAK